MKKLLIGLAVIVVLVIGAAIAIPFVVPVDTIKAELIAQAKNATGRDVRIDGDFKLAVFPNVEFVAGKVSFGNAGGGKAKTMISLDRLAVRVGLMPLLSGDLQIDAFVLEKPRINLEIDKNGRPNWEFTTTSSGGGKTSKSKAGSPTGGAMPLSGVRLGDVRLVDGTITYSDARTGASHRLDSINWKIALPALSSPAEINGAFVWNKEKIDIALTLATPNTLLNAKKTSIEAKIDAAPIKLTFNGSATTAKVLKADGQVFLDVPSIRKLAEWAGSPLSAPGSGYGPLKIAGTVGVDGPRYAFKKATLSVDKISGSGDFAFDGGGKVPAVSAVMKLGMLDLNPYLALERTGGGGAADVAKPGGGAGKPADWSDDPIDLSGLKAANATLDLFVEGILVRKIKVGESNLKVALKNGVLVTELTKMALYGGNGSAKITANAAGSVPKVAINFDLKGFQANPFLTDAAGFERLEGTANADLAVTATGGSQRQLVSALNGKGKIQFLNGAIRGINLAAMLRNVSSAFLSKDAAKTQKTDFAELKGTYTIAKGIVTNTDLSMQSPFFRIAGKGTVNLPKRTVNYRVTPKVVASSEGQGGTKDTSGITVPVVISGPWHDVSYTPDLTAIIGDVVKDPSKALDTLKKAVPGLPKLPGTSDSGSGGGTPVPSPSDAVKGLKGLFGR